MGAGGMDMEGGNRGLVVNLRLLVQTPALFGGLGFFYDGLIFAISTAR